MLTINTTAPKVVRSGRLALPIPDWQTGALLLRHERMETRPLPDLGRRLASYGSDRAKRAPVSDREPALP